MLVVFAVLFFDRVKIDDPVGALSVHLVNGVFGTLCVGLFASRNDVAGLFFGGGVTQLLVQLIGSGRGGAVHPRQHALLWFVLKLTIGIRVSAEEEIEGLDMGEHGMEAYPGFTQATSTIHR